MNYEKKIVEEMVKDSEKYFNNKGNTQTNNQLMGMREVFRGSVVK